jgi:hypothetical protein
MNELAENAEREHEKAFPGPQGNTKLLKDWNGLYIPSAQKEIDPILEQLNEEVPKNLSRATMKSVSLFQVPYIFAAQKPETKTKN